MLFLVPYFYTLNSTFEYNSCVKNIFKSSLASRRTTKKNTSLIEAKCIGELSEFSQYPNGRRTGEVLWAVADLPVMEIYILLQTPCRLPSLIEDNRDSPGKQFQPFSTTSPINTSNHHGFFYTDPPHRCQRL